MKIFVDSSIFFKWIYGFLKYEHLNIVSRILEQWNKLYISEYVINELIDKIWKFKYIKTENELVDVLREFRNQYSLNIISTKLASLQDNYLNYVNDPKDVQILADAVCSWCNILLTDNLKDFKIDLIKKDFGIEVVDCIY